MKQFSNKTIQQSNNPVEIPSHFESLYPAGSRFTEVEKILALVKEGKSIQIVSLPGVGRSNLLGLLSYNRFVREKHLGDSQKWFHFVKLDFSEVRKKPLADVWKFMLLEIADSLRERKLSPVGRTEEDGENLRNRVNEIFKESMELRDELVLFQGLKKTIDFLCIEKELTVVLLFDRFEEYLPSLTSEFFAGLRVLRNRAKYRFSAVFSLNRPLGDIVEPTIFSDFYEFIAGNIVYLPIEDPEGLKFRISYLEKASGKKVDKEILKNILSLTGGHGKLTRLSAESILSANLKSLPRRQAGQITNSKLTEVLLKQKTIQSSLYEIWNALLPEEQRFFTGLSLRATERSAAISDIPVSEAEIASSQAPRDDSEYLEKVGLIRNSKITIPLFEMFIKNYLAMQPSSHTAISLASSGEIKKGEENISDKLSASEYRLLKFLIENAGRICEKEELINVVWKDTKTQEGVTNQALDQIIYRLRKKIEDDPNNPAYVQTVKGRGIKLIA